MTNLLKKVLLMLAITVIIFSLASCQLLDMLPDELVEKIPGLGGDDHEHVFSDATCTTPATCECGETEGEALGHSFVDGKCACGEEDPDYVPHEHSYVDGKCECGAEDPNYVPPHVHSYETVVTAPTCTEAGYTTYTCACGDSYKADETAALGHTYETVVTAPTCTEAGYTTHTCSCGDKKITDRTAALGHSYDFVVTAPTCTEPGYTTYTCACGDVYVGNETAATDHTFAPATCTAPATCHCGATEGEALGHKYLFECDAHCMVCGDLTNENAAHSIISVAATEPACFEDGNNAYYTCEHCGNCWLDEELTQVTNRMSEIIPMIGKHVYEENFWFHPELEAATCCTPGVGVMECRYCDDYYTFEIEIDPYAHGFWGEEEIITEADCTTQTNGLKKVACANGCGTFEEYEIFYSEAHEWDVQKETYATCTEDGEYYAVCTLCGEVEEYYPEASGHYNYSNVTCGGSAICVECGIEYIVEHDLLDASCDSAAWCVICWQSVGEPIGHNYVDGFCTTCYSPNYEYMYSIEIPETPTLEYLEGIWYGEEYDAEDNYFTFIITLGADGKGTVSHSGLGEFNVTYTGVYDGYIMMVTNNTPTLYLIYNEGTFILRTEYEFDTNMSYGTYLYMFKIAGKAEPAEHEHNFVDGKCECGAEDPNYVPPVDVAPEEITREYLAGTWYGIETGAFDYAGDHTFVIIIDEYGKSGIVKHSLHGEFKITGITIYDTDWMMMDISGLDHAYMISLHYENGVFTLNDGKNFSYGYENFTMSKTEIEPPHEHNFVDGKCECGEEDPNYVPPVEIPTEITREYLAGTWYGTETGAFDYEGEHTFVIIIDEYGKSGIVKHSLHGEFKITGITIYDTDWMMMDLSGLDHAYMISLHYENGVFTLNDGKNFSYGYDHFTMSKTEPEAPHEHEFVDGKCECGEEDPNYVPPVVPEYPEFLDYDYLTGTWIGTETDYEGNTQTFTIEFDGQMGTVTHSSLGTFGVMVEISYGMIYAYPECEFDMSIWMYSEGVIYLFDGMKSFTGGDVLTMTKGEAEEPAPHEHNFAPATCTTPATCECGATDGEALGHTYMFACDAHCMVCGELTNENAAHTITLVPGTPATCTTDGKADVYTCEICGYGWLDEELTIIANRMNIVLYAGHTYMFACDAHCMVCGELTNENAAHSITLVTGTPATCTTDGVADVYKCEICGYGWLDEELTIIANRMNIVLYAAHDFDEANCTSPKTCAICDATEGEALGHIDENGDFKCDRCSTKVLPDDGTALTIPQALAIAKLQSHNTYTTQKYYITGIVTNLYNTQYGNFYIKDADGNEICIYGLYSSDGKTRYDAMSYKPVEGDEVTVYTVLGAYNTTYQGKSAWLDEVVAHTHDYSESVTAPTCTNGGYTTYTCSICKGSYTGNETDALGHTTENGTCDNCGLTIGGSEPVIGTLATFDFGANGSASHVDGNDLGSSKSYTSGSYTLNLTGMSKVYGPAYDAKGNSCIKLGTSKVVGSFSFTVGEDVTEVVIYVAKYKSNTTKVSVNGTSYTISGASNNGEYDAITIDTSVNKTVTFTTVASNYRCMINAIEFKGQIA